MGHRSSNSPLTTGSVSVLKIAPCSLQKMNGPRWTKSRLPVPAIWERMFEEIPSPNFGLNFDPSHFIWLQMDYLKPLVTFADRIFHVHAKDVRLDKAKLDEVGILATPLSYHTPKLARTWRCELGAAFFSILSDTGYDGAVLRLR